MHIIKATLENLVKKKFSLSPPTVVGCNTTITKTMSVWANVQPYTQICCHVEEATKVPLKAHKISSDLKAKQCGTGLIPKLWIAVFQPPEKIVRRFFFKDPVWTKVSDTKRAWTNLFSIFLFPHIHLLVLSQVSHGHICMLTYVAMQRWDTCGRAH